MIITNFRWQNCQSVILDVKLAQTCQFADFTRNIKEIVVTQSKLAPTKNTIEHNFKCLATTSSTYDLQVLQVADARWQKFKVIIAQVQSPKGF